jgi:hypothetical protein
MRPVCYQKEVRDREAAADPTRLQDKTIGYTIEKIGAAEAREFILKFEYLGTVGRSLARYGARTAVGELAAVALFGLPGRNHLSKSLRTRASRLHCGARKRGVRLLGT